MKKLILLFFISISAHANDAFEPVTFGTNSFYFAFQDSTLTSNEMKRILTDWKVMTKAWTDYEYSVEQYVTNDIYSGEFIFHSIEPCTSYTNSNPKFYPLIKEQGNLFLIFPTSLTTTYREKFQLYDKYKTAFEKVPEFITALQTNNLRNMPTNAVRDLFYFPPRWEEIYDDKGSETIRQQLLLFKYFSPGIIHFQEISEITEAFPQTGLWMWLPHKVTLYESSYTYFMKALYMDGKWKIQPLLEE